LLLLQAHAQQLRVVIQYIQDMVAILEAQQDEVANGIWGGRHLADTQACWPAP
jgi:hypothetical protein